MFESTDRSATAGPLGKAFLKGVIGNPDVQARGAELCLKCCIFRPLFEGEFPIEVRRRRGFRDHPLPTRANVGHSEAKRYYSCRQQWLSDPIQASIPSVDDPPTSFIWDDKWPVILDGDELAEILSSENARNRSYWRHPYKQLIRDATSLLADRHKKFFDVLREGELVAEGIQQETRTDSALSRKEWDRTDRYLDLKRSDLFNKTDGRFRLIWESLTLQPQNQQATARQSSKAPLRPSSHTLAPRKRGRKQAVGPRIEEAMRLDIKEGRQSPEGLDAMLEKEMEAWYGASRDTCRKVRKKVLSEFIVDK